jgi:hypothetical protein
MFSPFNLLKKAHNLTHANNAGPLTTENGPLTAGGHTN